MQRMQRIQNITNANIEIFAKNAITATNSKKSKSAKKF